jgi:hypothetical protein
MRRIRSLFCAPAVSGHAVAAPPSSVMNSRRLIAFLRTRDFGQDGSTSKQEIATSESGVMVYYAK